MITWLASFPRSGNTLFRLIMNRLYGIESFDVYGGAPLAEAAGLPNYIGHRFVQPSVPLLAASSEHVVIKTHDLPGDDAYPAIYVVRDGRDALVSYAHFALAIDQGLDSGQAAERFPDMLRNLVVSTDVFGGWSGNVRAWAFERTAPTVVVRFEELLSDPRAVVQRALASLPATPDATGTPDDVPTFAELHQLLPTVFRRGVVAAWRDEMPIETQRLFWERHADTMLELGYAQD